MIAVDEESMMALYYTFSVIARSEATKQSRGAGVLDCSCNGVACDVMNGVVLWGFGLPAQVT
jgi:hypothetical protein